MPFMQSYYSLFFLSFITSIAKGEPLRLLKIIDILYKNQIKSFEFMILCMVDIPEYIIKE